MGALDGIRILDLSRVLAGPYCGQLLADHGADVIKIESLEGDECRLWGKPGPFGLSYNYNSVNRGKRCMTLNLKKAEGQRILAKLISKADVLIHSFLPKTANKLNVDYDTVRKQNPKLIYCSISGFGSEGDLKDQAGYDLMMQAFSGAMALTGYPDSA